MVCFQIKLQVHGRSDVLDGKGARGCGENFLRVDKIVDFLLDLDDSMEVHRK